MTVEDLNVVIQRVSSNIGYTQTFLNSYFSTSGDTEYKTLNDDGEEVIVIVPSNNKYMGALQTLIEDSFSGTIEHPLNVNVGLGETIRLGLSHTVSILTNEGGSLTSSGSFNATHGGGIVNATDWITEYFKLLYPDTDLADITRRDNIITADDDIVLAPGLADENMRDGESSKIVIKKHDINAEKHKIYCKEVTAKNGTNSSSLSSNILTLEAENDITGDKVRLKANLYDDGTTFEVALYNESDDKISKAIQIHADNKQPLIDNSCIMTSKLLYIDMFVDAVDGDNNNDGLTTSTPKKTIHGCFDYFEQLMIVKIYLKEGMEFDIPSRLKIDRKIDVKFDRWGDDSNEDDPRIKFHGFKKTIGETDYSASTYIHVTELGMLTFYKCTLVPANKTDGLDFNTYDYSGNMIVLVGAISVFVNKCTIDITDKTGMAVMCITKYATIPSINVVYGDYTLGDEDLINNRSFCPVLGDLDANFNYNNSQDQLIRNIKRDADTGIPLNVNTNLDFVD